MPNVRRDCFSLEACPKCFDNTLQALISHVLDTQLRSAHPRAARETPNLRRDTAVTQCYHLRWYHV
jgi:hypothetical protein